MAKKVAKSAAKSSKTATKTVEKKKHLTKAEVVEHLAEETELNKKDVQAVLDSLQELITQELVGRGSPGVFVLPPNLIKIEKVRKGPTKEREGRNPQTGETITIEAQPAKDVIKARPMKGLNEILPAPKPKK